MLELNDAALEMVTGGFYHMPNHSSGSSSGQPLKNVKANIVANTYNSITIIFYNFNAGSGGVTFNISQSGATITL